MHGGKDYTPAWRVRQRGRGPYAEQIALRFRLAAKRLGLNERTTSCAPTCSSPPSWPAGSYACFDSAAL